MDDQELTSSVTPDDFVEEIKKILENLYDFPFLQHHPFALKFVEDTKPTRESAAARLRHEVMAAIEALSPGPAVPFRSLNARLYNLLHLRYVDGQTVQETARELGVSERQAYRDLRRGEESVAAILWTRLGERVGEHPDHGEINHIERQIHMIDLFVLLEQAQKAVNQLALQYGTQVELVSPIETASTTTEPMIAQQVMVSLVSTVIQEAQPGRVVISLTKTREHFAIVIHYSGETPISISVSPIVQQLLERLGWVLQHEALPGTLSLHIPAHNPKVLVIDDNDGLVDLIRRFLADQTCHILATDNGRDGVHLAQEHIPDAIILDVMMPDMNGWEVLQILKTHVRTSRIPVVVCSVFNDPGLAYSLGAAVFIAKPINRDRVLDVMHQLNVV